MDFDDSFDDSFDEDFDDDLEVTDDNLEMEDEPSEDGFAIEDAILVGTMMGLAYEAGLEERRRKKLERKMLNPDDSDWCQDDEEDCV